MEPSFDFEIRFIPKQELESILPLVESLNPKLEPEVLRQRLQEMKTQSYQCVGGFHDGRLIAICGLWITTRFYSGKQLEPDNVIIHPDYRSLGLGQRLMDWIYQYAKSEQCEFCELNAYVTNTAAHRFYLQQGFAILGFHFVKRLE